MANKKEVVREQMLQMRVSEEEFNKINDKASKLGMSTSNYMRLTSLHATVNVGIKKVEKKV